MAGLTARRRQGYELLYESCLVRPKRRAAVDQLVARITANKARYAKVGKALGVPWYVVGIIHSLEAGGDFSRHLHNGDPLTARTTHVPAGRPPTGRPPFTWEQSAIDALRLRGMDRWKDWSIPGTLYELEGYNGFGYRDYHPNVPSPYLWSFSNHYTRGKYVADGRFSPTAVSQQVGAAVLLKQLVAAAPSNGGLRVAVAAPRVLQLSNPHVTGPDVKVAQQLLLKNPFGSFDPGTPDGEYGELTAGAVKRAKWELGFPANANNSVFGPQIKAYLSGTKPLPAAFKARRAQRLKQAGSQQTIRKRIVQWALWGCQNTAQIGYTQNGNLRLALIGKKASVPMATDCSGFATLCYQWAGAPNPNAAGAYDARQPAFTGSMLAHCRKIPKSAAQPGDLVVWTPPSQGQHVCLVVQGGADPLLVSHGDESGPKKLRFSAEDAYQRQHGHGTAVWLTVF
jgi:lysozyme family protein/peptidoglycan hydrolase-like protein with peptidoglycan-binding domain